jgi:hypothetical protein
MRQRLFPKWASGPAFVTECWMADGKPVRAFRHWFCVSRCQTLHVSGRVWVLVFSSIHGQQTNSTFDAHRPCQLSGGVKSNPRPLENRVIPSGNAILPNGVFLPANQEIVVEESGARKFNPAQKTRRFRRF